MKKNQKEHSYAPAFSRNIYETLDHKKWSNISWKYRILKIRRLFQKIFRSIMALIVLRNGEFHETSPPASKLQRIFIRQHSELFFVLSRACFREFGKADESKYWKKKQKCYAKSRVLLFYVMLQLKIVFYTFNNLWLTQVI